MTEFAHLHVHSQFSFLVSTVKLKELVKRTKELGMKAVALTDHANMFGAIRFYKECKSQGIQPILGCELNLARGPRAETVNHMVVLASTLEGYHNLVRLVSRSHTRSASETAPSLTLDQVAECSKGLVALSGCMNGHVPQRILEQGADHGRELLAQLRDIFEPGHLFVELQQHGLPEQPVLNDILVNVAQSLDLPLVATNDVHFLKREDAEAQAYLDCVRRGRTYEEEREHHHGSSEMYLKSGEEMLQTFSQLPEAVTNSYRIAEMCSGVELKLGKPMLPKFSVPEGFDTDSYLRKVSHDGLEARFRHFQSTGKEVNRTVYVDRLERELGVIIAMQYPGYFLIVWDFIREAKARGIPVGPGRGSGAGSLVAYCLGITELDPLPYNLLFERFLNPERVSMPDFDVDFCMSRRDRVIAYVAEKYGVESVGQIATFQNLKARSVIKDVARTMSIPATEAQRIASLVPDLGQGKTATIDQALEQEPKLKALVDSNPQVAVLITQARKLEGLTRHAGMHAAGVVISDGPLEDHVPCFSGDGSIVTQYDKDDVEAAGLVKFDFLGLKTLTVIDIAQKLVNARPDRANNPLDLGSISLDDRETFQLIASGDTTGVFQLESSGMQQLLKRLKPDCFEDIVAAVALYRPGPLGTGMIDDYIETKHGRKPLRSLHPLVDEVLAPTYGVPVYQEQVMQIAQYLAGYSLGGADMLRRAMGKKKREDMEKQQKIFVAGALQKGVSEEQSMAIFKEIEGFAEYGFNKSHSAAYALVTYHTGYLKAHYPTEFFAAELTADKDKIDKVVRTIAEARAWGVSVLPPDINASFLDFTIVYSHPSGNGPAKGPGKLRDRFGPQIRFGLGAVRGLGESALETVFLAREQGGLYKDMFDFAGRVDAKRLNRGVLEALVQCGAFDSVLNPMGVSRARAFGAIERALERSKSASRDRERGQTTLFGLFAAASPERARANANLDEYPVEEEWDRRERLKREKASLGCYVSGHPLLRYGDGISRVGAIPSSKLAGEKPWSEVMVAGMVEGYREKIFKATGGKAAFFEIEDMSGRVECKLRADRIDTYASVLTSGEPVLVTASVVFPMNEDADEEREPTLNVSSAEPLGERLLSATRLVSIRLDSASTQRRDLEVLRQTLEACPGNCPVQLVVSLPEGAEALLTLDRLRVTPNDQMLSRLERAFGDNVADLR